MEIVVLEHEPDPAPCRDHLRGRGSGEFVAKDPDRPALDRSKCADQGQNGCLSTTGRPHQEDDFAAADNEIDAVKDIPAELAAPEGMADLRKPDRCIRVVARHQKTSAGSAAATRRNAMTPAIAHMATVSPKTSATRLIGISTGIAIDILMT
jgi:hypothetical protein